VKATVCMHFNPLCSVLAYQKPGWCLLFAPTTLFTWDKKALMPFRIRVEPWRASGSLSCTDLRPFSSYTIIKKLICSTCSADITFTGSCCQFVWPTTPLHRLSCMARHAYTIHMQHNRKIKSKTDNGVKYEKVWNKNQRLLW
jgi:hypothetical protein